jgi:uncharacterized protein (DUF58 family)
LEVAATTVRLLGRTEVGGTPTEMPGVGTEYYEMREYQPGDDYRNVNWKATARLGELIVAEHMKEAGGSYQLLLDARAPGFRETDELASTFLSLANSLVLAGVNFGILVHDGESVIALTSDQDPKVSLTKALRAAVMITKLDTTPEFLELVPLGIVTASVAPGSEPNTEAALSAIAKLRKEEMKSRLKRVSPVATASRVLRETQTRNVIYLSGLFGDVRPVMELAWEVRQVRNAEFTVANPCDIDGVRGRYERVAKGLQAAGVSYLRGEPVSLLEQLLAR